MAGPAAVLSVGVIGGRLWGEVRPAVADDAASLAALDSVVNPSPWTSRQFAAVCGTQDEGAERALVIDSNGQPGGFVVYSRVIDEVCIHNIAVYPSWQGNGIGELLLNRMMEEVVKAGATRCYLEVRASNHAARGLYRKLGFQLDGVRANYYRAVTGREDALLMSRLLGAQEC